MGSVLAHLVARRRTLRCADQVGFAERPIGTRRVRPWVASTRGTVGWKRRVIRAWWSSRSSKPSPRHSVPGGGFDSHPLRHSTRLASRLRRAVRLAHGRPATSNALTLRRCSGSSRACRGMSERSESKGRLRLGRPSEADRPGLAWPTRSELTDTRRLSRQSPRSGRSRTT